MSTVDDWLTYLTARGRTDATITTYTSIMGHYTATAGDPITATLGDAEAWWGSIGHLSPAARTRALSCVRSFYTWAHRFDLVSVSPIRRLDPPKIGKRLPRPIGRQDWALILDNTEGDLRRAVCLGAWAGLRVHEAAALDWADINLDGRRMIVRGKGDKERAVGLPTQLIDTLLPQVVGNVITAGGKPLSANALQTRVNAHLRALGVQGTYHKLRARFATKALEGTGNLLAVSRALGHASPTTTALYAATSDADLDLIADAATK